MQLSQLNLKLSILGFVHVYKEDDAKKSSIHYENGAISRLSEI